MHLSHYLKIYSFNEKPGYLLLYSTKKASMILLKKETYNALAKGVLSPENEAMLSSLGMMVPDREEEKREVSGFLDEINLKNPGLNISVIINLDCNFNCIYCYEGSMKGKFYMAEETVGPLMDFIRERFLPGKKSLNIDFYGGEPLLSANLIKSISVQMKSFTECMGASYTFTLVTNGSLFKRRIAEELAALGLKGVKITVDGPPEVHNVCRPFKSGAGSFDTIFNNIKETNDIVKIAVGGNFQRNNFEKFRLLIDYMQGQGLSPDRIHELKFDAVMNRPGGENPLFDYIDGSMSVNEPWVIEASTVLREEVLKMGYNTPKITPTPCQVEIADSFVINMDGGIYKCPALIGQKGFEIGSLWGSVTDYSESHKLGIWKNPECRECVYLPLCFGGCRYMAFVRDGNIDKVDCKKPFLDSALETLIKQDIRYRS